MVVNVKYNNRDLRFSSGSHSGSGISNLLEFLSENKDTVSNLIIKGETGSYTFERQIYLLANIISSVSGFSVIINGEKVSSDKVILPVYGN